MYYSIIIISNIINNINAIITLIFLLLLCMFPLIIITNSINNLSELPIIKRNRLKAQTSLFFLVVDGSGYVGPDEGVWLHEEADLLAHDDDGRGGRERVLVQRLHGYHQEGELVRNVQRQPHVVLHTWEIERIGMIATVIENTIWWWW